MSLAVDAEAVQHALRYQQTAGMARKVNTMPQ